MYPTTNDRDLLDLYIEELRGEPVLKANELPTVKLDVECVVRCAAPPQMTTTTLPVRS